MITILICILIVFFPYLFIHRYFFLYLQQDTVGNLKKAQALYISRQQELERARETLQKAEGEKMEKRKKTEEEAVHKVLEISDFIVCDVHSIFNCLFFLLQCFT